MRFALLLLAAPAAASVVTSATVTAALGSQTCAQSGPSARCDLRDGAAYAVINAGGRADLLSMSVSVGGDAINGGWARGSASASYDQMVVIDGGTGAGLLTVGTG